MTRTASHSRSISICLVACTVFAGTFEPAGAAPRDAQPLRIRVELIVDARQGVRQYLERVISREVPRRIVAEIGALSQVDLAVVRTFSVLDASDAIGLQPDSTVTEQVGPYDKVLHLRVEETLASFEIVAQDYDARVRYLCPPVRRQSRQRDHLVDVAMDTLLNAFSPVVTFQQIPEDPEHVLLEDQLALPSSGKAHPLRLRAGDVLIPILRREAPDGDPAPAQTEVVPWTVLVVQQPDDGKLRCRVIGSSRRPLGVRRRGRIEQLAVVVRPTPAPVTLRLVTNHEPRRPLPGCSVFLRGTGDANAKATTPLGVTDQAGEVDIPPGDGPVQVVWIKSGGLLLGKLPVLCGLHDSIVVPLADDPARIRAEADLAAVRTELVDLVARRNILLARGHAALRDGDVALARRLAVELEQLATRAQFNQRIDSVAQTARSQDRLAQSRIDKLVEETRSVLGQYLDPRDVAELRNEILNASNQQATQRRDARRMKGVRSQ